MTLGVLLLRPHLFITRLQMPLRWPFPKAKEAMDLAIAAWGNYGPVEVNIVGSSVNAAL